MFPIAWANRGRGLGAVSVSDFSSSRCVTLGVGRSFLITIPFYPEVRFAGGDITLMHWVSPKKRAAVRERARMSLANCDSGDLCIVDVAQAARG